MNYISILFKVSLASFEEIFYMNCDYILIDDLVNPKIDNIYLKHLIAFFNAIKMHKRFRDYDFIYVPSNILSQILGLIIARIEKKPFVIKLKGNNREARMYYSSNRIQKTVLNIIDKEIYKRANLIISVSKELTKKFEKLNGNIITLWNGVENRFFKYKPNLQKKSENIIFGYVGRISPEKGYELMFKLIEDLPIKLLIFGNMKQSITLPNNAEYLGFIPHEQIEEAYSKFDVLLLPSFTEGLPKTIQEAMLLEKAVICTDVGDNNLLIDERGGWVCQPRIQSLRKAVLEAISIEKEEISKMGIYNKHKAREIFYNWEEYVKKLKNIIQLKLYQNV